MICGLLDRALGSLLLQLSLPHSQLLKTLPAFSLGCASYRRAAPGVPWCPLGCPSIVPMPSPSPFRLQDAGAAAPTGHGRAESSEIGGCSRQGGLSPPLWLAGAVGTARLQVGLCPAGISSQPRGCSQPDIGISLQGQGTRCPCSLPTQILLHSPQAQQGNLHL